MKKEDLTQDGGALSKLTRELCYVKNSNGKYETELSTGWETKKVALENAWEEIERRKKDALDLVNSGKKSPIYYFMEEKLMDLTVLSGYTGFSKWRIKRHFKPSIFKKMNARKLQLYADAFEIHFTEIQNFDRS